MKIVIRAGGAGTRLWPISRQDNPKQFQAIMDNKSLIRNTVDRIKPLLKNKKDFFVSVNNLSVKKLKAEIDELADSNIIAEPAAKNTGPAICLESCVLARRFGKDVIVASLPSDDYISGKEAFYRMLRVAEKFLEKNPDYIITPGARTSYPDIGYSYIKAGRNLLEKNKEKIFEVADWVEKPNSRQCRKLIRSGRYFCHTGMYLWKLENVLELFKKFQPKTYKACEKAAAGQGVADYVKLKKMTVESAITSKAPKTAMVVSGGIGWSDLGKWHIISRILPSGEGRNIIRGNVLNFETKNSLVYGPKDKLIATIGLDNMIVILTEDALLVCPKDRSAEVKKIVEELKKGKLKKFI